MRAVALLAVVVVLVSGCAGGSSSVVAPYVVGLKESLATQVTERAGLKPEVSYKPDDGVRQGFVFFQSIREGSTVDEGDTLTISVSTGPR